MVVEEGDDKEGIQLDGSMTGGASVQCRQRRETAG
jgi:hypothetical protein